MLRKRKIGLGLLGSFVVVGAIAVGYSVPWLQRRAFLRELQVHPILIVTEVGAGGMAPCSARLRAVDTRKKGIDLFGSYLDRGDTPELRAQLAYLLLLQESQPYLQYASDRISELSEAYEFHTWLFVLRGCGSDLSADYSAKMRDILAATDLPYVRLFEAEYAMSDGEEVLAVDRLLDLCSASPPWMYEAFELLREIPEAERVDLLLPYLDSASLQGVYAAYVLAAVGQYEAFATRYLENALNGGGQDLTEAASKMISWIERAKELNIDMGTSPREPLQEQGPP